MANKRMFNIKIVDSDAFLDMPLSAQCLYFHLNMRADDDGFIGNPKRIMRIIGSNEDDLKLLILKRFVLCFDDGVIVIKHWRMHNCIQSDRYTPTVYQDEAKELGIKGNKAYTLDRSKAVKSVYRLETNWKQNVSADIDIDLDIDKDIEIDKEKEKKGRKKFAPPSVDDVRSYCQERKNGIDAQSFVDFYESKGWMVGKNKMKDWKAAVRTWERRRERTSVDTGREAAEPETFSDELRRMAESDNRPFEGW